MQHHHTSSKVVKRKREYKVLMRMWSKWNYDALLVGI